MNDVFMVFLVIGVVASALGILANTKDQARELLHVIEWWLGLTEMIIFVYSINNAMGQ